MTLFRLIIYLYYFVLQGFDTLAHFSSGDHIDGFELLACAGARSAYLTSVLFFKRRAMDMRSSLLNFFFLGQTRS